MIIINKLLRLAWAPLALWMSGCTTVGPDYVKPEIHVSPSWNSELNGALTAEEMDPQTLATWWMVLNDPQLTRLVELAISSNIDLKQARERVREARARRGITRAGLFPAADAQGSVKWSSSSSSGQAGEAGEHSGLYSLGFDAGWEADLFGGIRRSVEVADAELGASVENLRDVLVTILAEVALNYIDLRTFQTRLAIAENNLQAQNETYLLTLWRSQAGLSDELAMQQARYNLESTQAQLPALRTGIEEALNRIAILLGEEPGSIHALLKQHSPIPKIPSRLAVGIPADVLRNRPDIRKAERELAAQSAKIGVAKADLYPHLTLSGTIGINMLQMSSTTHTWSSSFGPGFSWAIFDAGAIRQNIEVQLSIFDRLLLDYKAVVLSALEEVENALVAYREELIRLNHLKEAAHAAQQAVELAQFNFESGLSDFTTVLEAQRSQWTYQDQLAQSEGAITANLIRLYKALGGGWTSIIPEEITLNETENSR